MNSRGPSVQKRASGTETAVSPRAYCKGSLKITFELGWSLMRASLSLFLSSRTGALNIPIGEVRVIGRSVGRSGQPFGATTIGAPRKLNEPRLIQSRTLTSRIATSRLVGVQLHSQNSPFSLAKDETRLVPIASVERRIGAIE